MKIAVCDDSVEERKKIVDYIRRFEKENNLEIDIEEFRSGIELTGAVGRRDDPDLIMLDIYMNGISGMEAAREIRANGYTGDIIFSTSSIDHGIASYTVNAVGYLIKPYDYDHFRENLRRVEEKWRKAMRHVTFLSRRLEMNVYHRDISFIETSGKGCIVHARDEELETAKTIGDFASELCADAPFLRVGKSYVVNLNQIKSFDDDSLQLKNGAQLQMPVREKQKIKQAINDYRWKLVEMDEV